MKLKNLIYSLLGIAVPFLVSILLSSCDPTWATNPKFNGSLVIFNDLEYPVSIKSNFDIRNGCLYAEGEREQIIQQWDTIHIVADFNLGDAIKPFRNVWKRTSAEPIHYRLYRLNPETYEEEEMIKDWEEGSYFFDVNSWECKTFEYATKKHPVDICEFTFNLW